MKGLPLEEIDVREIKLKEEEIVFKTKTFLTFVYVVKGEGTLAYDDRSINFSQGKLFIIPQQEEYRFKSEMAQLISIQCPAEFIDKIRLEADRIESCENLHKLQYISHNYHARAGCIFRNKNDEQFAETLILQIANEFKNKAEDYLIIRNCMSILLNLIARNIIQSQQRLLQGL